MILAAIHIKCHFNPTHLCLSDNDFLHQAANCAKALVAEFYDTCDSVAHSVCFTHCIISTFSTSITTFCNGFTIQNSSQSKLILIPFHCIEYCVFFPTAVAVVVSPPTFWCLFCRNGEWILSHFAAHIFCQRHNEAALDGNWYQVARNTIQREEKYREHILQTE